MTSAAEIADLVAGAMEGANAVVVARWEGPADQLATPAVVVSPGDPWLELPRLGGLCHTRWSVAVVAGRWEAEASLELAVTAYLNSAPLLGALDDFVSLDAMGAPFPEQIGGTPTLVCRFDVTVHT